MAIHRFSPVSFHKKHINMKKFIQNKFCAAVAVASLLAVSISCEEEGDSFDVSTTTYFPTFEFPEGSRVVITTGSPFTPNAVVKEGETELTPEIDNAVNVDVPGIYEVTYSAVNSDGYPGSASQEVNVYDPNIVPTDVRGNIVDVTNPTRTGVITLVPGTTNLFYATDMGFASVFPLYFQMNGDVMTVVPQPFPSAFGVSSVDASFDPVTRRFSVLINPQGFSYTFKYE